MITCDDFHILFLLVKLYFKCAVKFKSFDPEKKKTKKTFNQQHFLTFDLGGSVG